MTTGTTKLVYKSLRDLGNLICSTIYRVWKDNGTDRESVFFGVTTFVTPKKKLKLKKVKCLCGLLKKLFFREFNHSRYYEDNKQKNNT